MNTKNDYIIFLENEIKNLKNNKKFFLEKNSSFIEEFKKELETLISSDLSSYKIRDINEIYKNEILLNLNKENVNFITYGNLIDIFKESEKIIVADCKGKNLNNESVIITSPLKYINFIEMLYEFMIENNTYGYESTS